MTDTQEEFSQANVPVSNWVKFTKVGDSVIGTLLPGKYVKPAVDDFAPQVIYPLKNVKLNGVQQAVDDEWYLGVTIREGNANFVNNKFAKVIPGQRMGLLFEKEIPAKRKGYHPAKSYLPNVFGMDPEYKPAETFTTQDDPTVQEEVPFK